MPGAERREATQKAIETFLNLNNQARDARTLEELEAMRKACVEQARIITGSGHRLSNFIQQQLVNRFGINPETLEPLTKP